MQHVEQGTDISAHHYGLASFSYPKLLKGLLGSSKRGNMSECGVLAALMIDQVHPTELGQLLLTDVLALYLAKAQKYHQANKAHLRQQELSRQRVGPLHHKSLIVPRMTCYGMAAFLIRRQGPEESDTAPLLLPVSNFSEGWEFVEMERGKYQPAWISNTTGSVLQMTVEVENSYPDAKQSIGLSFLSAFGDMGSAMLSCIKFCHCPDTFMNGHAWNPGHYASAMVTAELKWPESSSASSTGIVLKRPCVLQVEVLNKTFSQGHKFKVLQLMVTTWVNVSDHLSSSSGKLSQTNTSASRYHQHK